MKSPSSGVLSVCRISRTTIVDINLFRGLFLLGVAALDAQAARRQAQPHPAELLVAEDGRPLKRLSQGLAFQLDDLLACRVSAERSAVSLMATF